MTGAVAYNVAAEGLDSILAHIALSKRKRMRMDIVALCIFAQFQCIYRASVRTTEQFKQYLLDYARSSRTPRSQRAQKEQEGEKAHIQQAESLREKAVDLKSEVSRQERP